MKRKSVLIIEDNELNLEMLSLIIDKDFNVVKAHNGLEALNYLKTSFNDISLILTDIYMPIMNGYEFLDNLKKDPQLSLIPVIVMTQANSDEEELLALKHGANDFLPKPYKPQIILHRISNMINLRETSSLINIIKRDNLTGLYTKEYFYSKVEDILNQDLDTEYSIICTNIEKFKVFNEVFSAKKGDELLKELSEAILKLIPQDTLVARFSADRFIIFIKSEHEKIYRKNFLETSNDMFDNIVVKLGVYKITQRNLSVNQMVDRAVLACNSISGIFDTLIVDYDEKLKDKLLKENYLYEAMEDALTDKEYKVFYQPKYDIKRNVLVGSEALIRWHNKELGIIPPNEFIPLFEANGFIVELDRYVLEEVFSFLHELDEKNLPLLPISVNISRIDILKSDLLGYLKSLVQKYKIHPKFVHLEITESAYIENPKIILNAVDELKKQGFIIEMDDFGNGYSSLSMFSQMNIDYLKLDMNFIRNELITDDNSTNLVSFIIDFAHKKGIKVVAEGIETYKQCKILEEFNCDYAQGYFFYKPLNEEDYLNLLKTVDKNASNLSNNDLQSEVKPYLIYIDNDDKYYNFLNDAFNNVYQVKMLSDMQEIDEFFKYFDNHCACFVINSSLDSINTSELINKIKTNKKMFKVPLLALIDGPFSPINSIILEDADDFLCKQHLLKDVSRKIKNLIKNYQKTIQFEEYAYEADHDYVTGLLNRRGLHRRVNKLKPIDFPLSIYLFDIDNLKFINDNFGHEKGDLAICCFAKSVNKYINDNDIICRYGGDEFLLISLSAKNSNDALTLGNSIGEDFKKEASKVNIDVSCSSGCTICYSKNEMTKQLLDEVDKCLYKAKKNQKGYCTFLDEK